MALAYAPRKDGSCSRAHAHALRACAEEGLKVRSSPTQREKLTHHIGLAVVKCPGSWPLSTILHAHAQSFESNLRTSLKFVRAHAHALRACAEEGLKARSFLT